MAIAILSAALSSAQAEEAPPPVDKCGHPIVTDSIGAPYKDPVCTALSDTLQPPLYIPDPDCNMGVAPYDSRCFLQRLFTVMTASPGPAPRKPPRPPYPTK
ncbi:MAG: hypothetical protein FJX40_13825 [Alphaproteobacteria bacterium]|nr:hypothetical protein [Alphaproteobacteria bacterium]MBM3640971.1 hypothetical protein [Alphaproteobacteria bacterium]